MRSVRQKWSISGISPPREVWCTCEVKHHSRNPTTRQTNHFIPSLCRLSLPEIQQQHQREGNTGDSLPPHGLRSLGSLCSSPPALGLVAVNPDAVVSKAKWFSLLGFYRIAIGPSRNDELRSSVQSINDVSNPSAPNKDPRFFLSTCPAYPCLIETDAPFPAAISHFRLPVPLYLGCRYHFAPRGLGRRKAKSQAGLRRSLCREPQRKSA